ncbi:hypothetical protein BgAZ_303950 [Babesia gibsoni]|uniref:Uncharacterized protein n=1 Tax=Babesia gibsoni TaxID=33632 RepID=A0AAD8PDZ0_BABGI|nr:hypothetical protein BgAZ_303950 [Babesia gibsoni]
MGLGDLSETQQQLLHPLIRLKHKSSLEAMGTLAEVVGDLTRLYEDFTRGLRQLERKVGEPIFIKGISNKSSLEALSAIRSDLKQTDNAVISITKEQKGMIGVWNGLFTLVSRIKEDMTDFVSILNNRVTDPLNSLYDEFKGGFSEPVDQLQMNDVLNFIPNLILLKQAPGFSHCGAKKYVDSVIKAYKELQHCLQNEQEVIGDSGMVNSPRLQAKAVNKTVKAKISLGKQIKQLFEVAPEMKQLLTKSVSQDTIERLATMKLRKAAQGNGGEPTDLVAFQNRFCNFEKKRLSVFSSSMQAFAEAIVKYQRKSYNDLKEVYQSILEFSPESDYGQFEAHILGAMVSHASKHSRMMDDIWLSKDFTELEDFDLKKKPSEHLTPSQPDDDKTDDAETVIDNNSVNSLKSYLSAEDGETYIQKPAVADMENVTVYNIADSDDMTVVVEENSEEITEISDALQKDTTIISQTIPVLGYESPKKHRGLFHRSATLLRAKKRYFRRPSSLQKARNKGEKAERGKYLDLSPNERRKGTAGVQRSDSAEQYEDGDEQNDLTVDDNNLTNKMGYDTNDKPDVNMSKKDVNNEGKPSSRNEYYRKNVGRKDNHPETFTSGGIQYYDGHFSSNPLEPPRDGVDFDFDAYRTALDILKETSRRSDAYFVGLCINSEKDETVDLLKGDIFHYVDKTGEYDIYPFELAGKAGLTENTPAKPEGVKPKSTDDMHHDMKGGCIPSSSEYNLRRLFRLPYTLENDIMDGKQWNLVALEQLVILHKYLTGYLTHPSLSDESDPTLRDFLLINLGVIEHLVVRIRNFIETFRSQTGVTNNEFKVLDAVLTPRDTFVNTSPHIFVHQMDIRYRIMLVIDTWEKNDISIGGELLFEASEFYDFLYRQLFIVRLSMIQKLARAIRRLPTVDVDLDKRWLEALESEDPKNILNVNFRFTDNKRVDRIANKILFLLCECIGRLNYIINVVKQRQWGEDSVFDSNYMSVRDQLVQIVNMTVELEKLDIELLSALDLNNTPYATEDMDEQVSDSSLENPFKLTPKRLNRMRSRSMTRTGTEMYDIHKMNLVNAPQIKIREAQSHFCTSMSIFEDEDISLLRRVGARNGCFGGCGPWRPRKKVDAGAMLNPYFTVPLERTTLSLCWKLENTLILRLAACYHDVFSDNLQLGDWCTSFTTIEYVVHFISTGCLLNFLLYKKQNNDEQKSICTLYQAVLSSAHMYGKTVTPIVDTTSNQDLTELQVTSVATVYDEGQMSKDIYAILQVPLNLAAFPKMMGDVNIYLQHDLGDLPMSNTKGFMEKGAPKYSSLQLASFIEGIDEGGMKSNKMQMHSVHVSRPGHKVHRLLLDAIKHNVPMIDLWKDTKSISLIKASSTEQTVQCLLMLRAIAGRFRNMILRQIMECNIYTDLSNLAYNLATFILLDRLMFPNELLTAVEEGARPLDSLSLLEGNDGAINMDALIRSIICRHARTLVNSIITKIDAFGLDDVNEFVTASIESLIVPIRETMRFTKVWDEFLPMGDFQTLFTNCCIYFLKADIRQRISMPLDVCKVMPSVHKMRLLQREIEASRHVKASSSTKESDLMRALMFSFRPGEDGNGNLLEESSDLMDIVDMSELEKKFATFSEIINRAINHEDWTCIASQTYTSAVVDLAAVLNATIKATLELKVPFDILLIPLTGSMEAALNHYYISIVGGKASERVDAIMSALGKEAGTLSVDLFNKFDCGVDLERGIIKMSNILYLARYLCDTQDTLLQYCHRMLKERCEESAQLHRDLETNIHSDSRNFFNLDIESLQGMKEINVIYASRRLIKRQTKWHVRTISSLCSLKELHKMALELYQPTVTDGPRLQTYLGKIKTMCTEFGKLGEEKEDALESLFEVLFNCMMYAMRSTRWLPREVSLLNDDLRVLQWVASEHQHDVSRLLEEASKLIK